MMSWIRGELERLEALIRAITNIVANPTLLQTRFAEVTADQSTNSLVFVDVPGLSLTVNTSGIGHKLNVFFSASTSNTTNNRSVFFRLVIDGVARRATAIDSPAGNDFESCALVYQLSGVAAGAHVVKIQWSVDAGTGQIHPIGDPNESHGSLLVEEVTV